MRVSKFHFVTQKSPSYIGIDAVPQTPLRSKNPKNVEVLPQFTNSCCVLMWESANLTLMPKHFPSNARLKAHRMKHAVFTRIVLTKDIAEEIDQGKDVREMIGSAIFDRGSHSFASKVAINQHLLLKSIKLILQII